MMQFIRKHWFLISLLLALLTGYGFADPAKQLAESNGLKWTIVAVTLFLMAWPIQFASIRRTILYPWAPILATLINMVAIPLIVWPIAPWVGTELGPGMIVAAATPCTLASAAVWTRRAGGNDAVAILVTLITNATCFLVTPFWVYVQTGNSIDPASLMGTIYKLLFFVVLPMGAAQVLRIHRPSAEWASDKKPILSLLALLGILAMVFLGSVNMTLRLSQSESHLSVTEFVWLTMILLAIHCSVFWGGLGFARTLQMSEEDAIAVGFSGSQKTLMVGLSVAMNLGMSIIPIITYHAVQLIVDTAFADWIRNRRKSTRGS